MDRKLIVYDWKIIARDEDFRKYKKVILLELDMENFSYPVGTELQLNGNSARITKIVVDIVNSVEYYEAVALDKWL